MSERTRIIAAASCCIIDRKANRLGRGMKAAHHIVVTAALAAVGLGVPAFVRGQADEEAALSAVRAEIEAVGQRIARQTAARDASAEELKRTELRIAAGTAELGRLRAASREQQGKQQQLAEQAGETELRLATEREALARQVRISYITGRQEMFKLLLSQGTPADLGRMMVYYDHFNRARSRRIMAVSDELRTLTRLGAEASEVERELDSLRLAEQEELQTLDSSRGERGAVLARHEASIEASGDEMARLRDEEARLVDLLVSLGDLLAAFPGESEVPFAELRGRLSWPIPGRLAADYGQPRGAGALTWNGVLLDSPAGTPVRAIYHGRVAFSDWLPGLGLLVIVDHGDGFMSLYGRNEALLKATGDRVTLGEAIAQVGDTGGQARPSLYFEIRRDGEPEDPHSWIAGLPAPN